MLDQQTAQEVALKMASDAQFLGGTYWLYWRNNWLYPVNSGKPSILLVSKSQN